MSSKERVGIVVSNKMNKTVVISVKTRIAHAKYTKVIGKTKRYKAHDEKNICEIGDQVLIQESKPLSKTKQWIIREILLKASKLDIKDEGI
nr:ribosomal protein S17 [Cavernulicola chilensis]